MALRRLLACGVIIFVVNEGRLLLARNGFNVCVFTLSCFLAKLVIVNKEEE